MRLSLRNSLSVLALAGFVAAAGCDDDPSGPSGPVNVPASLTATSTSATVIAVSWTAVPNAAGYILERTTTPGTPASFARIGGDIAGTAYNDNSVVLGTEYTYRVAAFNATDTSAFSGNVAGSLNLLSGNVTANRTLTADRTWVLRGYVKVQNGVTLTVDAGTRIVGDTTVLGSSLWILRGAKIVANGTAVAPIVFTSARSPGNRKPGDWGGIIIIGNGQINRTGTGILTEGGAVGQAEDYSGGTAAGTLTDSSGVLRYVRIEFAGYDISGGGGQELNSLSMYAVGRKTVLEYVQALAGLDDAFEWWGGGVDGRYLVSYETGDDHFDWSEGYQGRNQFLVALQTTRLAAATGAGGAGSDPRGFEGDGCDGTVAGCTLSPTAASTPYSMPVFANFTMVGPGTTIAGYPTNAAGAMWRRGTGGTFMNGIIARFRGVGISIFDPWTDTLFLANGGKDSLQITNILVAGNAAPFDTVQSATGGYALAANWPVARLNTIKQFPTAAGIDTLIGINLTTPDWTPTKAGSPANTGGGTLPAARVAAFFGAAMPSTAYLGAADPAGTKWWTGWTSYAIN